MLEHSRADPLRSHLLLRVLQPESEGKGCRSVQPVPDNTSAYRPRPHLLARMVFPRHQGDVQTMVHHLQHDMPADLLHAVLLERMNIPALERR